MGIVFKLRYVVLTFLFINALHGQDTNTLNEKPTYIGLRADYGFIIIHSRSLREIRDSYPFGARLDIGKHLLTAKAWEYCNCYPRVGVDLGYWYWDNPEVLGHGGILQGYLEPTFGTQRQVQTLFRMTFGSAFLTRPHDPETNPDNLSYSSNLNFNLSVGLGLNVRLYPQWNLRLLANYNHISNGGSRTPNKGINYPTITLGIDKSIVPIQFPEREKLSRRTPPSKKYRISLASLSGWSNVSASNPTTYYVQGVEGKYSRWIGSMSAFSVGTEWVADFSRRASIEQSRGDHDFQRGAALIGHEFWLGRITFSQQLGVYYYSPKNSNDPVYQRYGLTLRVLKHAYLGFNLKSHRHVADFFDIRVGVVW